MLAQLNGLSVRETSSNNSERLLYEDIFPITMINASSDDLYCNQRTDYAYNKQLQRKNLVEEIKRRTVGYYTN